MPVSQNGWPASPDPAEIDVTTVTVAGIPVGDGLASGRTLPYLTYVAEQFHRRVEPLVDGWCWGYKYRPVTGGTELSNHASGTAVDLNAPVHPLGQGGTFTPVQVEEIHRILGELGGIVRWGGDYAGRVDEMHFEINRTPEELPMQVLDYSAGFPGALNIVRDGYLGAVRYIGFPDRRKCTTRTEFEDFSRNGIGMALVYEDTAGDWRGGFGRGREAGARARWHADQIGFPAGRPIYMAIDQDVATAVEFSVMSEYLRGAAETLGGVELTGVYGEHDVCLRAQRDGVATWFWQTRAWSGTPIRYFPDRHLFQNIGYVYPGGIQCDTNDVLREDWGQHLKENDMTSEEREWLRQVWAVLGDAFDGATGANAGTRLRDIDGRISRLEAALSDDEAKILAAVRAQPTGGQIDVPALAAALAPLLPHDATPEQIAEAVRHAFATHLGTA